MCKDVYRLNARLTRQRYGDLICTGCGKRLARVIAHDYRYLHFFFVCNCGSAVIFQTKCGKIEVQDDYYADMQNGVVLCKRCCKELFYVDKRNYKNFGFHIVCSCGKRYNKHLEKHT